MWRGPLSAAHVRDVCDKAVCCAAVERSSLSCSSSLVPLPLERTLSRPPARPLARSVCSRLKSWEAGITGRFDRASPRRLDVLISC